MGISMDIKIRNSINTPPAEEDVREGDRELVGGGGERQIVPLLQLALVVVLLEGDHLVAAQAGQSAAQQRVRVLLVNLNTQGKHVHRGRT